MTTATTSEPVRVTVNGYEYSIYKLSSDKYTVNVLGGTFPTWVAAHEALERHVQKQQPTQEQQPTPRPWTFRQLDEGGQRISNGHGPVGETYSPNDAALIVRAVNERDKLIEALRELTTAAAAFDNQLHAGFKVSELSAEQSKLYNAVNTAKAALFEADKA